MAKEILAIPEEMVGEVIKIIMLGLSNIDWSELSKETPEFLIEWCHQEEEYINS